MRDGQDRRQSWRERVHEIIFEADTPMGKAFDIGLILAIFASVAVVVLSTLPSAAREPYRSWFYGLEWFFTILFTIEYVIRLLVLRLLRIFRVFKLARYLSEASALREAFYISRHKIAVFMATVLIVVLIASALMHVVEGGAGNTAFDSIPGAMYWAIITMTTVGYGDVIPITVVGKVTTTMLVLVGYSLIIVPTGILSAEITDTRRKVTTRACRSCMAEGHDLDAKFCKRCGAQLEGSGQTHEAV